MWFAFWQFYRVYRPTEICNIAILYLRLCLEMGLVKLFNAYTSLGIAKAFKTVIFSIKDSFHRFHWFKQVSKAWIFPGIFNDIISTGSLLNSIPKVEAWLELQINSLCLQNSIWLFLSAPSLRILHLCLFNVSPDITANSSMIFINVSNDVREPSSMKEASSSKTVLIVHH